MFVFIYVKYTTKLNNECSHVDELLISICCCKWKWIKSKVLVLRWDIVLNFFYFYVDLIHWQINTYRMQIGCATIKIYFFVTFWIGSNRNKVRLTHFICFEFTPKIKQKMILFFMAVHRLTIFFLDRRISYNLIVYTFMWTNFYSSYKLISLYLCECAVLLNKLQPE